MDGETEAKAPCEHCGTLNFRSNVSCYFCGKRLAWSESVVLDELEPYRKNWDSKKWIRKEPDPIVLKLVACLIGFVILSILGVFFLLFLFATYGLGLLVLPILIPILLPGIYFSSVTGSRWLLEFIDHVKDPEKRLEK